MNRRENKFVIKVSGWADLMLSSVNCDIKAYLLVAALEKPGAQEQMQEQVPERASPWARIGPR